MKKLTKSYIVCSKCKTKKKTAKKQMEKLIASFGSLESVHSKYHCIECRRKYNVRKDGKPKPVRIPRKKKKKFERDEEGRIKLPDWMRKSVDRNASVSELRSFKCPEGMDPKKFNKILVETAMEYFAERDKK